MKYRFEALFSDVIGTESRESDAALGAVRFEREKSRDRGNETWLCGGAWRGKMSRDQRASHSLMTFHKVKKFESGAKA